MNLTIYQVDAFAEEIFQGNPAAVCILEDWLPDDLMQDIAQENNLSETAFLVRQGNEYGIRWFTPGLEVDLCGHATLASAFILFEKVMENAVKVDFHSPRSGPLAVEKGEDGFLILDFPADEVSEIDSIHELNEALGAEPKKTFKGKTDIMLVFENQSQIEDMKPNFHALLKQDVRGVIVTAPGDDVDFVSRFFAPQSGINEDPVTGSAHTTMIPYWSKELGKEKLSARQLSRRGGSLRCELAGDRVKIGGKAVLYMEGELQLAAKNQMH